MDIGALTAFVLLHASVIGWYAVKQGSPNRLRYVLTPALGIAVTVAVIWEASHTAQVVGVVWLVVGLAVVFLQQGGTVGSRR